MSLLQKLPCKVKRAIKPCKTIMIDLSVCHRWMALNSSYLMCSDVTCPHNLYMPVIPSCSNQYERHMWWLSLYNSATLPIGPLFLGMPFIITKLKSVHLLVRWGHVSPCGIWSLCRLITHFSRSLSFSMPKGTITVATNSSPCILSRNQYAHSGLVEYGECNNWGDYHSQLI